MPVTTHPRAAGIPRRWRVGAGALGFALIAGLVGGAAPTPAADTITLSLVGTTDLHGYVFPNQEGRGGLAVLGGYLANLRAARASDGGGVVLVDAGDTYLGGIESMMSEGAVVVDAYNALGYTAAALGNHDLEFGPVDPRPFGTPGSDRRGALKALARQARYPMLAANLLLDATTQSAVTWPNVRPSTLVTVAGVRVGLVGVMTRDALSLTLAANVQGLATDDLVETVTREARTLRASGAQVIVVVAHAGGTCGAFGAPDDLGSCDDDAEIFEVARRLPVGLVTAIMAGHTHDAVAHRVAGIPIAQAWSWGRAFSRIDIRVSRADGVVRDSDLFVPQEICAWRETVSGVCAPGPSAMAAAARYEGRAVAPLAAVTEAMAPALRRVEEWRATPIGVTVETAVGRGPGDAESPLGNLFATALQAVVPGADGALSYGGGPGGLRADLRAGPLTLGAVYDLFPFDNRVVPLTISGADLRALLLDHLRRPRWRARALGVAGLRIAVGCRGGRDDVEVTRASGAPLADDDMLTLVVTDFLAARVTGLKLASAGIGSAAGDVQVRDAALAWLRARPRLATGDLAVAGAPRWARSDASVAGCQTPRQ